MTKLDCMRTDGLISRRSSGLSAAEALRLEEHLTSCTRCGRDAALLGGLRELASAQPISLPPVAREQAIRRAIAQAAALPAASSGLQRLWPVGALSAAALVAAAAAFALVVRNGMPEAQPDVVATGGAPAAADAAAYRVLSGDVEIDGYPGAAGTAFAAHATLRARADATVMLGHAEVQLLAGTTLRWNGDARTLRLDAGRVIADVDPKAGKSFAVETERFSVLVLGTRFEVSLDAVAVERGRVRVLAADGIEFDRVLGPGERMEIPNAAQPALGMGRRASRAGDAPARARHARPADATALIAQARAQLVERRVADARRSLEAALAATRDRNQRAEAMSLRAECALVDGDLGSAVEAYLRVARTFARHPAGQNALFAAARLEAERERSAAAITLLERYLARYPKGRFVKEARTRLRELGAVLDHEP